MAALKQMIRQITALSWLRCSMEEGVQYVNKHTQQVETDEILIYRNLEHRTGAFDLPSAKCSAKGLEKNVLEVVGNLHVWNKSTQIAQVLASPEFAVAMRKLIEDIRIKK